MKIVAIEHTGHTDRSMA